jgi:hypothetical protein
VQNVNDHGRVDRCGKNQMAIATPCSIVKKALQFSSEIAGTHIDITGQSQKRLEECMSCTIRMTGLNDVLFLRPTYRHVLQPISLSIYFYIAITSCATDSSLTS